MRMRRLGAVAESRKSSGSFSTILPTLSVCLSFGLLLRPLEVVKMELDAAVEVVARSITARARQPFCVRLRGII